MRLCLITGASGFLAQHVGESFANAGVQLVGLDRNLPRHPEIWTDFRQVACENFRYDRAWGSVRPDVVCHLAGPASVAESVADPFGDFMGLVPGTAQLLSGIATELKKPKFILFSSAAVYGNATRLPITEKEPIRPISPYGIHKATTEILLQHYSALFGIPSASLRLFSAYGPGLQRQVVWDIVQKVLAQRPDRPSEISLIGTGNEARDFVYASDVGEAALAVASRGSMRGFEIYNVASGGSTTISDLAQTILRAFGSDARVGFTGSLRSGDPLRWQADIRRLAGLGWRPATDLRTGVARVVQWAQQLKGSERQFDLAE